LECRRCRATIALPTCHMASLDHKLSTETGWSSITHAVRFYGTCPQCA
jgi:Fe2+ or Zn2+ uptake regulation protein